jgi:2-methylcitrate dehydratase
VHLLDTLACAAGAQAAPPVAVVRRTVASSAPPEATIFYTGRKASVADAVLVNGTAVRYLDANDVFLGAGPGGHPSDNIPVAVNVAETTGSCGRDVLAAIAVGYDLVARLRRIVYRPSPGGPDWHEVSVSGVVSAAMTALLGGANVDQLTDAIAIGAAKGYALKEIRRGQLSMLKACANALVARDGITAATLALNGMAGPPEVFEGGSGLLRTFGAAPDATMIDELTAPPEWAIHRASLKPYPALGTSQAAIEAAVRIVRERGPVRAEAVERITIRLPDTPYSRDYAHLNERLVPRTRESADHSIQFVVALALLSGDVTPADFESERWKDDEVRALMGRTVVEPDPALTGHAVAAFPATVVVQEAERPVTSPVLSPPGSPDDPWGRTEVVAKFARLDHTGRSIGAIEEIAAAAVGLASAPSVADLVATVS